MKQDEFKKAIADGIVDAFSRIVTYSVGGMLVFAVFKYLCGFMKGLLG